MLLLLTAFLGCAAEPEPTAPAVGEPPPAAPPAPEAVQGAGGNGGEIVGNGGGEAPPGAEPPAPAKLEGLAKLATDGKTVEIKVELKGAPSANLDFLIAGVDGGPQPIAQEPITGPSSTLKGPKAYAKAPVWVCAWYDAAGDGPDPKDTSTCAPAVLKFDGTDSLVFDMAHPGPLPAGSPMANPPKPPIMGAPGGGEAGGGAPPPPPPQ